MKNENELEINGEIFIKKSSIKKSENWMKKNKTGKTLCLIRTRDAGVFVGYIELKKENGSDEIEAYDCFQVWSWSGGALSVLDLATIGLTEPEKSKFTVNCDYIKLNHWIEIVPVTEQALKSFEKVKRGC